MSAPILPYRPLLAALLATVLCAMSLVLQSCTRADAISAGGPVRIQYWEKWTGLDADAMKRLVDQYNASQSRVHVDYISIGLIDQKLLLATAGGNPPDVAGLFDNNLVVYAEKGALLPLDKFMERDGIAAGQYMPVMAEACKHRGFFWALPSAPSSLALHYNTKLFREAGLDPAKPPKTIAELNDYSRKLTKFDANGRITQLGFSPAIPGWWNPIWGIWFGAELVRDGEIAAANSPEHVATYEWIRSFPKEIGPDRMHVFQASGGNFSSSENLFIAGKLAMQLQGVYMYNYINKLNPGLEWSVAPFPTAKENLTSVTLVQADVLAIPRGAKHPEEAWDFIRYVQLPENLEQLALDQKKFPPLNKTSDQFYRNHPNPHIALFLELAQSPNSKLFPRVVIQQEYFDEMENAFQETFLMRNDPKTALNRVAARIQPKLDRSNVRWEMIADQRIKEWSGL